MCISFGWGRGEGSGLVVDIDVAGVVLVDAGGRVIRLVARRAICARSSLSPLSPLSLSLSLCVCVSLSLVWAGVRCARGTTTSEGQGVLEGAYRGSQQE